MVCLRNICINTLHKGDNDDDDDDDDNNNNNNNIINNNNNNRKRKLLLLFREIRRYEGSALSITGSKGSSTFVIDTFTWCLKIRIIESITLFSVSWFFFRDS